MKQDIRDLFRDEDTTGKALSGNHRQEFNAKLKASRSTQNTWFTKSIILKVAAVAILCLAIAFMFFRNSQTIPAELVETPIETQIEVIEKEYLASIDQEWQNFIRVTNDEKLIQRYKDKLEDLDRDYKGISKQFKTDKNNILVIEALVDNLKTRLQLLKDIQEHIKLLNQKTEQYETINI